MSETSREVVRWLSVAFVSCVAGAASAADPFPMRTVRLVVPYPPGASNDILARGLAQRLTEQLGHTVIIDNRPGAGGHIGAEAVARANPDGHTLLLGTTGLITMSPHVYPKLAYDPQKDVVPVTLFGIVPYVLAVPSAMPVKDAKELIAYTKAQAGRFNYASSGNASAPHLCGEALKLTGGAVMTHVPYKGGAAAVTDLVANRVQLYCGGIPTVLSQVKAGNLKIVAATTAQRTKLMPELGTVAEQAVPGFDVSSWTAVFVPRQTPRALVERLHQEISRAVSRPDMQSFIVSQGAEPVVLGPDETARRIAAESARWGKVAKAAAVKVD